MADVEKILEENAFLKKQNRELESTLDQILNSKSWKFTEMFRRVMQKLKAVLPVLRFCRIAMQLEAGRNVSEEKGLFTVAGISPSINLLPAKGGRLPRGWVRLRAALHSERNPVFFLLYFGKNGDFNPHNRAWLNITGDPASGPSHEIFRIPEWTTELRLDPFDSDLSFSVAEFEIQEIGKLQVVWSILARQLGMAFKNPRMFAAKGKKLFAILREGGLAALRIKLFANNYTSNYPEWVKKYDTITEADCQKIKQHIGQLSYQPLISIIMPVYNTPEKWLRAAIESVRKQLYSRWELCIADDASSEPHVKRILQEYAAADERIKVHYRAANGHISEASNSALQLATGEYCAMLDHDDELREHALYMVVERLNKEPRPELIYSDEDKLTSYGMRFNPYFKPDWNVSLLLQQNFICHLTVCKTERIHEVGGFRKGFEGAQDWDLFLRVTEKTGLDKIAHIPFVLYHWRVIEGSTAQSTSYKPYVMEAQAQAVREHLERSGQQDFEVQIREDISQLRVKFALKASPKVSIIIPTKDQLKFLRRCIQSIQEKTLYKNFEITVVNNNSQEQATLEYFEELRASGQARIIEDTRPFNFSQLNNSAVSQTDGEVIAFLNNDLEVISEDWLQEMLSQLQQPGVGAVGAKLYYANDLIQHAGIVSGIGGVAGHSHKGQLRHDPGYFNRAILNQDVSGVTAACMLVKREVFEEVGGFDEENLAVAFNDVDLCLKIRQKGHRIVYCAYAELYHYESVSRGFENTPVKFKRFEREIEVMKKRWGAVLSNDPYYNPNLTLLTEDYTFAYPTRVKKPWEQ